MDGEIPQLLASCEVNVELKGNGKNTVHSLPLRASSHLEMDGSSVASHTEGFWKGQLQPHRMLPGKWYVSCLHKLGESIQEAFLGKNYCFCQTEPMAKGPSTLNLQEAFHSQNKTKGLAESSGQLATDIT